jgi:beta-xylosidase
MILRVGSSYYAYGTSTGWDHGGEDFPILRSNDLRFWRPWNNAMSSEPAWSAGQLWAPSVLAAHGRYFLYYSARRRSDGVHCLAVATARGPGGPFRDRGPMTCGDRSARGYIDPAALMHRGRGYLFFSVDGPRHSISALRLSPSLLRVRGARRVLVGTTAAWQRGLTTQTVEAPWPVWRDGRFYLLYSAGCWCSDYRMGYAVSRRPLGPYRGVGANPLLRGAPGLVAPGGGSLFRGRGGGSFLAFHAWSGPPDYDLGGTRTLRVAPVSWPGGAPRPLLGR